MTVRPLNIYCGELTELRKTLWRVRRLEKTPGRAPLHRLQSPSGTLIWGHPMWKLYALVLTLLVFAGVAWGLAGGHFDPAYWPLWMGAAICALLLLVGVLFVERFTLDANARRWRYQRGWRGRVREESGSFDDFSGFVLEDFLFNIHAPKILYVVLLDFADGYRFFHPTLSFRSLDEARAEAQSLARTCGLPLTERLER